MTQLFFKKGILRNSHLRKCYFLMVEVQGMESDVLLHKSLDELIAVVVAFLPSELYVCVAVVAKGIDEGLGHKTLVVRISRPKIN